MEIEVLSMRDSPVWPLEVKAEFQQLAGKGFVELHLIFE